MGPSVYLDTSRCSRFSIVYMMNSLVKPLPGLSIQGLSTKPLSSTLAHVSDGAHASFLETSVGPATLILIEQLQKSRDGNLEGDVSPQAWRPCAQLILRAVQLSVDEEIDEDGCEVLYGRAGLLYALLLLRQHLEATFTSDTSTLPSSSPVEAVKQLCSDVNIKALTDDIIERGRAGAKRYSRELADQDRSRAPALMWSWHDKRYLGAAHGVAGILQMLLCIPPALLESYWNSLLSTMQWLLDIQQPSGNWPTKAGRHMYNHDDPVDDADELIQWCHGAPGMVILLSIFLRRFPHYQFPSDTQGLAMAVSERGGLALSTAGELIYTNGLLRKGVGLCHGVAGSVYALLSISDANTMLSNAPAAESASTIVGEDVWFLKALHLAQLAISYEDWTRKGEMNVPDRPYSLYEGVAGMCCAWAELVGRLDGSDGRRTSGGNRELNIGRGMPGYDDIGLLT